jgi:hypothetical protein
LIGLDQLISARLSTTDFTDFTDGKRCFFLSVKSAISVVACHHLVNGRSSSVADCIVKERHSSQPQYPTKLWGAQGLAVVWRAGEQVRAGVERVSLLTFCTFGVENWRAWWELGRVPRKLRIQYPAIAHGQKPCIEPAEKGKKVQKVRTDTNSE